MNKLNLRAFLLLMLLCGTAFAEDDDDDDKKPSAKTQGQSINLTEKAQKNSGLQTIKLEVSTFQVESVAYGKVLPIQPLFELRQRYLTALTEQNSAKAKFLQATQQIERQKALFQEGVTSKRNLEEQQALLQVEKSVLQATQHQDTAIKNEALLTWGKTLTEWVLSDGNKLDNLLSGETQLLQITLPSHKELHSKTLYVANSGQRENAVIATLISTAPQTEGTQGRSYFFQTKAKYLSIGMNVTAWLPEEKDEKNGIIIPKSALIWVMDQAFVYVKTDNQHYTRRALTHYTSSPNGYFVSEGLAPNEELVVTGTQMLLSEELRGQIPDDD